MQSECEFHLKLPQFSSFVHLHVISVDISREPNSQLYQSLYITRSGWKNGPYLLNKDIDFITRLRSKTFFITLENTFAKSISIVVLEMKAQVQKDWAFYKPWIKKDLESLFEIIQLKIYWIRIFWIIICLLLQWLIFFIFTNYGLV